MDPRHLLGMLTPSSNTILEPVTSALLAGVPQASAHFSRFRVTEIALSGAALGQFAPDGILAAADLLADARCQVIGWNGTSASWLGFEHDERLCAAIQSRTQAQACTSVLALNEILELKGIKRLGLITPYLTDVQEAIVANYASIGIDCSHERHLGLRENFAFSEVSADDIRGMAEEVMRPAADGSRPDAMAILCTNVRGAPLAAELEARHSVPVYDSVSTVVWKALRLSGLDTRLIRGWGRLFDLTV